MVCLRPSEMRRLTESTSRTCTSTSCEVETILPGCMFFLVHEHFRDVDQALDARLHFDERAVVGDVGDAAGEARVQRVTSPRYPATDRPSSSPRDPPHFAGHESG